MPNSVSVSINRASTVLQYTCSLNNNYCCKITRLKTYFFWEHSSSKQSVVQSIVIQLMIFSCFFITHILIYCDKITWPATLKCITREIIDNIMTTQQKWYDILLYDIHQKQCDLLWTRQGVMAPSPQCSFGVYLGSILSLHLMLMLCCCQLLIFMNMT